MKSDVSESVLGIHHTGFVVADLGEAKASLAELGYRTASEVTYDAYQQAAIVLLRRPDRDGSEVIELVCPSEGGSFVSRFAKKEKWSIHHLCFGVRDIDAYVKRVRPKGFLQVTPIVAAPAIDNRRVCFLYSRGLGLFEIIEAGDLPLAGR